MIDLDDGLAQEYLEDCRERLGSIETGLLAMEKAGAAVDEQLVNSALRAMHSIKAGAGFCGLAAIVELAHRAEDVLAQMLSRKIVPSADRARVLLNAADRLQEMLAHPSESAGMDNSGILAELDSLRGEAPGPRRLRSLLVEDDFTSRLLLQTFLSRYGDCHIAVNGREAVEAFRSALARGEAYDLICMDIMMPEMDGREAVRQVRAIEQGHGIFSTSGARIVMTTAVNDLKEVTRCFEELCDAYLVKPIDLRKLLGHMQDFQLVR